jgi:hypothetical protein
VVFEYDVFLSFSAKDQTLVKPVWQRLMSSGIRVFWSGENMKAAPGKNFVSTIQDALTSSRDFVVYWTENAKASPWVDEEYQTFYSQCYLADKAARRLMAFCPLSSEIDTLPPFLRSKQAVTSIEQLVAALGGVDIESLKTENLQLRSRVAELQAEIARLSTFSSKQANPAATGIPYPQKSSVLASADSYRLSIHDTSGRTYEFANVSVKYPGTYGPYDERRGIRVKHGAAEVLLKWSDTMRLNINSSPNQDQNSQAKYTYNVEAALYTGNTLNVSIVADWNMAAGETGLLFGETELGETKIRFCDIDMIIPLHE